MEIRKVHFNPILPEQKKVCAYARVSSEKDSMLHSLAAQVDYYSTMIRHHKGWEYIGVYADEAKTGTKDIRADFQRMLSDARNGRIDLIITKSVSRFARNTVTLLESIRELKELGVDVYFEEQNIHSLSADGELMLTILASFAQAESLSVSENMKWRIKKNFEEGIPWGICMLGYRFENGKLVIVPKEAETVRSIFNHYLEGYGYSKIAEMVNAEGHRSKNNNLFSGVTVKQILQNYTYTGNILLQRTYRQNHINKKKVYNNGELPKYHAEGSHEAIIDIDTFDAVQEERQRRSEKYCTHKRFDTYQFTGLIECGICSKNYTRLTTKSSIKWGCPTYKNYGKKACPSKNIPEAVLNGIAENYGIENITKITANPKNTLVLILSDGSRITHQWKDRSRAESWTEEMKEKARRKALCQAK